MLQTNTFRTTQNQSYLDPVLHHPIETDHLDLEAIRQDDAGELQRILGDPDVMRYVGLIAGEVLSADQVKVLVEKAVAAWTERGYGRWTVRDKMTDSVIGFCGFRCEDGFPELICMLDKRFWNRELALEAARACLDYGFNVLNFSEVVAYSRPDHTRARRVLDKLDAEFTGNVDFHGVEGAAYVIRQSRAC